MSPSTSRNRALPIHKRVLTYPYKSPIHLPKSPMYPRKSPIYPPKNPVYQRKSPIYPQKSPTYPQKSPVYQPNGAIYPRNGVQWYLSSPCEARVSSWKALYHIYIYIFINIYMNIYIYIYIHLSLNSCVCGAREAAHIRQGGLHGGSTYIYMHI